MEGVEAVIHLGGASSPDAEWDAVLNANIVGTRNMLEAARQADVPRVILASSTHAVVGHEKAAAPGIYELDDERRFGVDVPPRPDSLYGASKVFAEALARWYVDVHGMKVISLRIGWVWDGPDEEFMREPTAADLTEEVGRWRARSRAIWLSQRDCVRLFRAALAATDVDWAVVYGTSDNPRQIWDLEPGRRLIGFEPLDRAPERIRPAEERA